MIIAIDFDGTIVDHQFPEIGELVPDVVHWITEFKSAGARLMLWTMRNDDSDRKYLSEAVEFCKSNFIEFDTEWVNQNPEQKSWTKSPKQYAHLYIDDAAFGCPLKGNNNRNGGRPFVDWSIVGPSVIKLLQSI